MDRPLQQMIAMFQYLPVHTIICDAQYCVVWVSDATEQTCPITVRLEDRLKEVLVGQELLFERWEQALTEDGCLHLEFDHFNMSFRAEVTAFEGAAGQLYSVWHLLLQQSPTVPLITSGQMLELGANYREALFQIYNSLMPLAQALDRSGSTRELMYLNMISENCQNMLKSTINVNEYLKLSMGTQLYDPMVISLKDEMKDLFEQANFLLKGVKKQVVLKADGRACSVYLDRYKLMLIVLNLLSNAVEHSMQDSQIEVTLNESEHAVSLTMRDYGDGMREAVKQSAFEPFFAYQMDSGMESGLGLGLYLVKELTEAQGGSILLASALHEGTTITIQFPKAEQRVKTTEFHSDNGISRWVSDRMSPLYAFLGKHCDLHLF